MRAPFKCAVERHLIEERRNSHRRIKPPDVFVNYIRFIFIIILIKK